MKLSLLFFAALCVAAPLLNSKKHEQAFTMAGKVFRHLRSNVPTDESVECAVCGLVVNEIEGFVMENISLSVIEQTLDNDVCTLLGGEASKVCQQMISTLPAIVTALENDQSVGEICLELSLCSSVPGPRPDPFDIPLYTVDLDLPPSQRWQELCSTPQYASVAQWLISVMQQILPDGGVIISDIGLTLNEYYFPSEYAQEISGCAQAMGIETGWLAFMNLGYEVSDACTSIVAQTVDGKIYHARNLDFGEGMGFTNALRNMTVQVSMQKNGETLFVITTFVGFVGVLSGMRPNAFSLTIDTRFNTHGLEYIFYEVLDAIEERNASMVSFLARNVMTNEADWNAAVEQLSNTEIVVDIYFITAGVGPNQGAVITRNPLNATDVWILDSPTRWFEVETNFDHWDIPPWFDDRVVPAIDGMNAIGQQNLTLQAMFDVLSIKPVFNQLTTYTILVCPADSYYKTYGRFCNAPCPL